MSDNDPQRLAEAHLAALQDLTATQYLRIKELEAQVGEVRNQLSMVEGERNTLAAVLQKVLNPQEMHNMVLEEVQRQQQQNLVTTTDRSHYGATTYQNQRTSPMAQQQLQERQQRSSAASSQQRSHQSLQHLEEQRNEEKSSSTRRGKRGRETTTATSANPSPAANVNATVGRIKQEEQDASNLDHFQQRCEGEDDNNVDDESELFSTCDTRVSVSRSNNPHNRHYQQQRSAPVLTKDEKEEDKKLVGEQGGEQLGPPQHSLHRNHSSSDPSSSRLQRDTTAAPAALLTRQNTSTMYIAPSPATGLIAGALEATPNQEKEHLVLPGSTPNHVREEADELFQGHGLLKRKKSGGLVQQQQQQQQGVSGSGTAMNGRKSGGTSSAVNNKGKEKHPKGLGGRTKSSTLGAGGGGSNSGATMSLGGILQKNQQLGYGISSTSRLGGGGGSAKAQPAEYVEIPGEEEDVEEAGVTGLNNNNDSNVPRRGGATTSKSVSPTNIVADIERRAAEEEEAEKAHQEQMIQPDAEMARLLAGGRYVPTGVGIHPGYQPPPQGTPAEFWNAYEHSQPQ